MDDRGVILSYVMVWSSNLFREFLCDELMMNNNLNLYTLRIDKKIMTLNGKHDKLSEFSKPIFILAFINSESLS